MADPQSYRPAAEEIPTQAGVYRFFDSYGRIIYVGKAKNLRNRLTNYFQPLESLHPRTRKMVTTAVGVKWVVVDNELAALSLEYAWIKEFQPRFNVMYRDDKSYPYLALTMGETYPRMHITRERKRKDSRYFGPYTQVWAIKETMDLLRRVFPLRTCTKGVFNRSQALGRPCLEGYIDKCCAPCVGRITESEYRNLALEVARFLDGGGTKTLKQLRAQMQQSAADLCFEQAAKLRDKIEALEKVLEKNTLVLDEKINADVYGVARDDLEMTIQVFYVRAGRVRGEKGWVVSGETEAETSHLLETFLEQNYGEYEAFRGRDKQAPKSVDDIAYLPTDALPPQIWLPQLPANAPALQEWLSDIRGRRVQFYVPKRGHKKQLLETVNDNAAQALKLHKVRRIGDLTQRSQALRELQDYLGLADSPLRIEGYDISHTQGSYQVGSMVVFEDGMPKKNQYRQFKIRSNAPNHSDDTQAMNEVLQRRFRHLQKESAQIQAELASGQISTDSPARRFSYPPDLVVVDGGLPQVNAAQKALEQVSASVQVIGLAKRLEEVWLPGETFPIILPRTSSALFLLQYLRDEAHRFAISAHRKQRGEALKRSALDQIPGLGPARQKLLLRHFGSLKQLRQADLAQISQLKGIGEKLAQLIYQELHPES